MISSLLHPFDCIPAVSDDDPARKRELMHGGGKAFQLEISDYPTVFC